MLVHRVRTPACASSTSSWPSRPGSRRPHARRDGGGGRGLHTGVFPDLPHRRRLLACRRPRGPGCRPSCVRVAAVAHPGRAGGGAGASGRGADTAAGLPARDPGRHPAAHARGAAPSTIGRASGSLPADRLVMPSWPTRSSGWPSTESAASIAGAGAGARGAPRGRGGLDHARRSGRVPGRPAAAHPRAVQRARVRVEPSSSTGGVLIAYGLALLDRVGGDGRPRQRRGDSRLGRGDARAGAGPGRPVRRSCTAAAWPSGSWTTGRSRLPPSGFGTASRPCRSLHRARHRTISVVDAQGTAASMTVSTRAGLRGDRARNRHPAGQHAGRVRPRRDGRHPRARACG